MTFFVLANSLSATLNFRLLHIHLLSISIIYTLHLLAVNLLVYKVFQKILIVTQCSPIVFQFCVWYVVIHNSASDLWSTQMSNF
jgi:hypothetical protein